MVLDSMFDRFIQGSPLSVMARGTIEHALAAQDLDALLERTAERQYTRELLFSSLVDLMSLVVCGVQPHVQAAFQDQAEQLPVTLKCVYEKLQRVEPEISAALVRFTTRWGAKRRSPRPSGTRAPITCWRSRGTRRRSRPTSTPALGSSESEERIRRKINGLRQKQPE